LINTSSFSQTEQDRTVGLSNADANERGGSQDRQEQPRVADPREHGEEVHKVTEGTLKRLAGRQIQESSAQSRQIGQ